jgi:hypothetical protein
MSLKAWPATPPSSISALLLDRSTRVVQIINQGRLLHGKGFSGFFEMHFRARDGVS